MRGAASSWPAWVDHPRDTDALDAAEIADRRLDGLAEAGCLAVEVDVLDALGPADRGIAATGLEDGVNQRLGLQVGALDDEGESVGWQLASLHARKIQYGSSVRRYGRRRHSANEAGTRKPALRSGCRRGRRRTQCLPQCQVRQTAGRVAALACGAHLEHAGKGPALGSCGDEARRVSATLPPVPLRYEPPP